MTCDQYRELLSAKFDKELTEPEQKALSEHLAQCAECTQYAEQLKELDRLTAEWEDAVMPPEVEQAILARAKTNPRGVFTGSYRIPRPVAWAAMIALIILSVNSLFNGGDDDPANQLIITPEDSQPVQRIVLTEADVVRTFATGSAGTDL